jgi:hypothetical protein
MSHRARIMERLDLRDVASLTRYAVRRAWSNRDARGRDRLRIDR